jgi:hypothetical protein
MDPHDHIVLGGVRVGHVRQRQSTDAGIAISNGDGLHDSTFSVGDCPSVPTRRCQSGSTRVMPCPRRRALPARSESARRHHRRTPPRIQNARPRAPQASQRTIGDHDHFGIPTVGSRQPATNIDYPEARSNCPRPVCAVPDVGTVRAYESVRHRQAVTPSRHAPVTPQLPCDS